MQRRRLGSEGPEISVIGYGAWEIGGESYGPNPDEDTIVRALHAAFDTGVNWVDTAEIYGSGRSEALVGKAMRSNDEWILVATKVAPKPVGSGFRPREVRRAAEASLRRLKVDRIDLFQLHWMPSSDDVPPSETWGAMAELSDEGLVRHIGVSNFDRETMAELEAIRHVDSLQPHYSMLHRKGEDLLGWCADQGTAVIVYGPLAFGLLAGSIDEDTTFDATDWRSGKDPDNPYYRELFADSRLPENIETVERLRPVAGRLGVSMAQLALAWTVHQPGVTAAITGSRKPGHNRENARAGEIALGDEDLAEIDDLLARASAAS